jgi:uncharacterized protein YegL
MNSGSRTGTTADDRLLVLAFYVVIDVSVSMDRSRALDEANLILPKVADAIAGNPTLGDLVRLAIFDFSDDARVVRRLGDLRDIETLPQMKVRGGTSYVAAFRLLRHEIEADLAQLRMDNCRVFRPAVFLVTDGLPLDDDADLDTAFGELTDRAFRARPNIVPFGVGDATKETLDRWVFPKAGDGPRPMRSYVTRDGVDPAQAVAKIAELLVGSVLASAQSVNALGDSGGFVPPDDEDLDDDWI